MKKLSAILLLAVMLVSLLAVPAAGTDSSTVFVPHSGDVEGDGDVDEFDYIFVKRHYFETIVLSDAQLEAADVETDDVVDQFDYILIKRIVMGTYELVLDESSDGSADSSSDESDSSSESGNEVTYGDLDYASYVIGSGLDEDFGDSVLAVKITAEYDDGEKLYIIDSEEEFTEFSSYTYDSICSGDYNFAELEAMLPDGFFEDNLLIFKYFTEPTLGYEYDVVNVYSDQEGITVNYKRVTPTGSLPDAVQETLVVVMVSKNGIPNVTAYDAVITEYTYNPEVNGGTELPVIRLSGISDNTNDSSARTYCVEAPYTDTYTLTASDTSKIAVYHSYNELIAEADSNLEVSLDEGGLYYLVVETASANANFDIKTEAQNHLVTLPYDVAEAVDVTDISLDSTDGDPLTPAAINYQKRGGGTYVYSNNPELIPGDSVGDAFIRTENLSGEVYFTFEHANYSGIPLYLGYQLKNEGDTDVYVTVTNIGYQAGGTWFGQLAWYDFYNTSFELPADYFTATGAISSKYSGLDYAYQNYTPRVFQPITYRLPAGEAFYVIGGTTSDAYNNINVDNTANKLLYANKCANGNVKFNVSGGAVTGTFYAYSNTSQVAAEPEATGYRVGAYAGQYLGTADHSGVIDNYVTWTFNDNTAAGALPVTYTNRYASSVPSQTTPYAAYNSTDHTLNKTYSWMTHLNPQNDHRAVGTDMVEFVCVDSNGKYVVIDNDHADGAGNPANTANWMIEYQDHFTLINQGDADRVIKLNLNDNGTLAILIRDSVTGEVIDTAYTAGLGQGGNNFTYEVTVPAHSIKQITLDYLLVACSYGNVTHSASIQ